MLLLDTPPFENELLVTSQQQGLPSVQVWLTPTVALEWVCNRSAVVSTGSVNGGAVV
jgi:hypothetical protein